MKKHLLKTSLFALSFSCFSSFAAPTVVAPIDSTLNVYGNISAVRNRLDISTEKLVTATNTVSDLLGVKRTGAASTIIGALDDLSAKIEDSEDNIPTKLGGLLGTQFDTVVEFRERVDEVFDLLQGSTSDIDLSDLADTKLGLITAEESTIKGYLDVHIGGTNKPATVSNLVNAVTGLSGLQVELGRATSAGDGMTTAAGDLRTSLSSASDTTITAQLVDIKSILGFEPDASSSSIVTRLDDLYAKSDGGDTEDNSDVYTALVATLNISPVYTSVKDLKDAVDLAELGFTEADALTALGFNGGENPIANYLNTPNPSSGVDATTYVLTDLVGTTNTILNNSQTGAITKGGAALTTIAGGLAQIHALIGTPAFVDGSGRNPVLLTDDIYTKVRELMLQLGGTSTNSLWSRVREIESQLIE